MTLHVAAISIDGGEFKEFDYIKLSEIIPASGAIPVAIRPRVFPASVAA